MFSAAFVCLFVCQHDNFRKSKHRMMKLGGRCTVQKSRSISNVGVIAPWVRPRPNVALGYDVGTISAGCVVSPNVCCEQKSSATAEIVRSFSQTAHCQKLDSPRLHFVTDSVGLATVTLTQLAVKVCEITL